MSESETGLQLSAGAGAIDLQEFFTSMLTRSVTSRNSKATYANALRRFFDWLENRPLTRETVLEYREWMGAANLAPATIGLRLTAIRQLTREARIAGLITHDISESICSIRGPGQQTRRTGNWLSAAEAARLILAPPADTLRGRRDRAIMGVLTGCGLRRTELVQLRESDIQQREGRWCIVDMAGKGRKVRTVPMPAFARALIDGWLDLRDAAWTRQQNTFIAAGADPATIAEKPARLFCSMDNRGQLRPWMSANAIYAAVLYWAEHAGLPIAPHDLRRTFSRLALAGKADLHQIQLSLGHSSIQTTERYLGTRQDLGTAPCDVLGIVLTEEALPGRFLEQLGAQDEIKEDAERLIAERSAAGALPDS